MNINVRQAHLVVSIGRKFGFLAKATAGIRHTLNFCIPLIEKAAIKSMELLSPDCPELT